MGAVPSSGMVRPVSSCRVHNCFTVRRVRRSPPYRNRPSQWDPCTVGKQSGRWYWNDSVSVFIGGVNGDPAGIFLGDDFEGIGGCRYNI